ncbi:MAG: TRAM domain-containing protein [Methanophagales archaeon]|nr:TRAM domain-containing protein [Methanophagales archaeon]
MQYRERRGPSSPLNIGDTYDVKIEDVGREGDGIARIEGFVVFVPNTKKGDSVKVRVTKISRRVGFAEVVTE